MSIVKVISDIIYYWVVDCIENIGDWKDSGCFDDRKVVKGGVEIY